jgi:hypothetical protein
MHSFFLLLSTFSIFLIHLTSSTVIDPTGLIYTDLVSTTASGFASELSSWTITGSTAPYYTTFGTNYVAGGYNIGGTF